MKPFEIKCEIETVSGFCGRYKRVGTLMLHKGPNTGHNALNSLCGSRQTGMRMAVCIFI